jgi:hypothetical protein
MRILQIRIRIPNTALKNKLKGLRREGGKILG